MKRWLLYILIGLAIIILLLIFVVPLFLPLEKIKDFAAAKTSELLKREVKIESVSFNLFTGFKLRNLSIGERKGFSPEPFVTADSLELRYNFWPLFQGKLEINKISLVKPKIKIERSVSGEYNFNDLLTKKPEKAKKEAKPPISISVSSFSLSKGVLTFITGKEKYQLGADLRIADLMTAPKVDGSLSSERLVLDPLLAGPKGKPAPYGALTKTVDNLTRLIPANLSLAGVVNLKDVSYRGLKLDKVGVGLALEKKVLKIDLKELSGYEGQASGQGKINLNVSGTAYKVDNLELKNLNAAPFSNAVVDAFLTNFPKYKELKDKLYGRLDLKVGLTGKGVEVPDILKNAKARGSLRLSDGRIARLKSLEGIADSLKISALKEDLVVKELKGELLLENKVLNFKELEAISGDLTLTFDGSADLGNLKYVSGNNLNLRLSERLSKELPPEYGALKDERGIASLDFELTGSLSKPIPRPKFKKPVERLIEREKVKVKEEVKKEVEKKKEELKEEAEKKLRELFK